MIITWTLLKLMVEWAKTANVTVPADVVTSTDEQVVQGWGLLNEMIGLMAGRGVWPQLTAKVTFEHQNGPNHLALNYDEVDPPISYAKRAQLMDGAGHVNGPISDEQWAELSAQTSSPTPYSWRRAANGIQIFPVAPVGHIFTLHYYMAGPVRSASGTEYKELFTENDDVSLLPGALVLLGLRYRWRMEKGLPYAELKNDFEGQMMQLLSADANAKTISLDDQPDPRMVVPGILIKAGNWVELT